MKTANNYITELKQKFGIESDYGVAKLLGISRQAMTKYKQGQGFDDKLCFIVAEKLDIDPLLLIAEMNVQRARTKEDSGFWKATIKKLNSSAATIFGVTIALPVLFESVRVYILC